MVNNRNCNTESSWYTCRLCGNRMYIENNHIFVVDEYYCKVCQYEHNNTNPARGKK